MLQAFEGANDFSWWGAGDAMYAHTLARRGPSAGWLPETAGAAARRHDARDAGDRAPRGHARRPSLAQRLLQRARARTQQQTQALRASMDLRGGITASSQRV
ncbi:MAG: hypothetical protein ACK4NM_18730, partial [Hydrogenophaga sp.]